MGRRRTRPLGYEQITQQAEKTINTLMKAARIETNSDATKEQCVSRAFGAFMLWQDLTANYGNTEDERQRLFDDDRRLFGLLSHLGTR